MERNKKHENIQATGTVATSHSFRRTEPKFYVRVRQRKVAGRILSLILLNHHYLARVLLSCKIEIFANVFLSLSFPLLVLASLYISPILPTTQQSCSSLNRILNNPRLKREVIWTPRNISIRTCHELSEVLNKFYSKNIQCGNWRSTQTAQLQLQTVRKKFLSFTLSRLCSLVFYCPNNTKEVGCQKIK